MVEGFSGTGCVDCRLRKGNSGRSKREQRATGNKNNLSGLPRGSIRVVHFRIHAAEDAGLFMVLSYSGLRFVLI